MAGRLPASLLLPLHRLPGPCHAATHRRRALKDLVSEALDVFFDVRKVPGLKKKPSTSELVDWLKLLMADNIGEAVLRERDPTKAIPPLAGALVKNEQDVHLLERLAFMSRRGNR
ncbi:ATPase AAA [Pseudomonas savastanoi pv. glycinea]|uniref:ATPase AAA n=1 Tax=Pseudomonas savastanoi pv. glycinea TaxID=318 RepID=A0A3M3FNN9_PSESG|nr:ATPase AAA [Pseudomonas savastanoi pv. glycinea]